MGIVSGGGYAERVAVHERQAIRVPDAVALADAGAIPEVWITAFDALVQGGLCAGATCLVHAGGSGVGTAAIQIARSMGATVVVTASASKLDACLELGAGGAVDYKSGDFVEATRRASGGRGADVVIDVVGGDYVARNLEALAPKGAIVQVGTMGSGKANVNLGILMGKRARMIGTVLRARPLEEKIAISQRFAREVLPGFERGEFRTVIDSRFVFDEIADAHRRMEANLNFGKIVIDIESGAR